MTQLMLIALGGLCLCLTLVFLRTLYAIVSNILQIRLSTKSECNAEYLVQRELSAKLRQTYLDLSMSRRQTVWRDVLVVKIVKESDDVRSFYLIDPHQEPLPASQPGQHILVERTTKINNIKACRCYSLSDDCMAGHWRISVKRSSDHPQSLSRWLHDEVSVGETLRVRGPSGAFYLNTDSSRHVVFASAGIGITPMLPMLIESIRRQHLSVRCYAQFRDVSHMPFADSLLHIAQQYPQVQVNLWLSQFPKGVKRSQEGPIHQGKFDASLIVGDTSQLLNTDYYLCGPEAWQERMQEDLIAAGVPNQSIRFELFQSSEKPVASNVNTVPCSIHFQQSNSTAKFEASQSNLLGCAAKNHINLESGCRTGACGSCAIRLLKGRVRYTRDPQFQLKSNEILPCVCVPESDLVVDA
jgi:uncharacterized protein